MGEKAEQDTVECQAQGQSPQMIAGPDREVWVRNQVFTAMRMALALYRHTEVGADNTAYTHALQGLADGVSIEILRTLGFSVKELVNLPNQLPKAWYKMQL